MLYLNQAGTSWPKHPSVIKTINDSLSLAPNELESLYEQAHQITCEFFNIPHPQGFLFTTSCTSAIYLVLSHLKWQPGDKIITSSLEHYALSSCLEMLSIKECVSVLKSPYQPDNPIDLKWVEEKLKQGNVKCLAISHGCNVTGEILPIEMLSSLAHHYGALILIDGAQTAGAVPIDLKKIAADVFVFAGHKGPGGPQGIGGLYIHPNIKLLKLSAACEISMVKKETNDLSNTLSFCDTGSVNLSGVLGLAAGLENLKKIGVEVIRKDNIEKTKKLLTALSQMPLKIYGSLNAEKKTTAVSFNAKDKSSKSIMEQLKKQQIYISHGQQCAPWSHITLGTSNQGVFRVSPGVMNTKKEIDIFIQAMEKLLN